MVLIAILHSVICLSLAEGRCFLIHEKRIRVVRTALKGGPNMNHRIVIRLQNSRPNVRPADYKRLITKTSKDRNNDMTVLELVLSNIRISEAKLWFIKLQKGGKRYSSIRAIKGVLKPAFQLAVDDDCIQKNPFSFDLSSVIANDSKTREGLNSKDEKRFLEFIKADPHFCRYYDGIYILFKTGLRISEFCGLTFKDVDFRKHCIRIDHQINKRGKSGYYIDSPKTENGIRVIPMTPDVEACFKTIISRRAAPNKEPQVDGKKGFLFLDKNGNITYSLHWEHYFQRILKKYNSTHRKKLPSITPHICRHTYCSNMAKSGMNPKTLQYLMGHSDISVTLNTYTHINYEDAVAEYKRLKLITRKSSKIRAK